MFELLESSVDSKPQNNRIKELTEKYLEHFNSQGDEMSELEAQEFLLHIESDPDADYRERRIRNLKRYLDGLERSRQAAQAKEERWMQFAREYVELTKKWESLGAFHVNEEYFTRWYYNGSEFYKWTGSPMVEEELPKAKAADERLMEIVNKESASYSSIKNPNTRYLEEKHFDDKVTNPNFVSYLLATGKQVGDPYRLSEARTWIDIQVAAFKRSNGRSEHEMLNEIDNWPDKLRLYLRKLSE